MGTLLRHSIPTSDRWLSVMGMFARMWRVRILLVLLACLIGNGLAQRAAAQGRIGSVDPEANSAVARISVTGPSEISYGSGSLVQANEHHGLVVTNWHVIQDAVSGKADRVSVAFPDGMSSQALVLASDPVWDLAALAIWRPQAEPIPVGTTADVPPIGEMLTIAGYGQGYYRATQGRCIGYYSPGMFRPDEFLEMSASARNGDSGGPILNDEGKLVGVLFGSDGGMSYGQSYTMGAHCGRVRQFLEAVQAPFNALPPPQPASGVAASPASMETQGTTSNAQATEEDDENRSEPRTLSSNAWRANTTNRTYGSQEDEDESMQGSRSRTDYLSQDSG